MITTEGEGEADIHDQDLNRARKEAMEDALQKAFELALFGILPEGIPLTEHQDLLEALTPMKKKFLIQYRILAEMPAVQVFFITVEATFSNVLLREELVRRGVYGTEDKDREPVTVEIVLSGVTSYRFYRDLQKGISREIDHVEDVRPLEVFGTRLVLRVKYRGDPQVFKESFNQWLAEDLLPGDETMDESVGLEISLSFPDEDDPGHGSPPASDTSLSETQTVPVPSKQVDEH